MNLTCQNVICHELQRSYRSIDSIVVYMKLEKTPNYHILGLQRVCVCVSEQYWDLTLIDIVNKYSYSTDIFSVVRSIWSRSLRLSLHTLIICGNQGKKHWYLIGKWIENVRIWQRISEWMYSDDKPMDISYSFLFFPSCLISC